MAFKPKPDQVDFTNVRWAPIINCVVKFQDRILIVQRSQSLNFYPGYWNGISGFLDDSKSLEEKIREELSEELSLSADNITKITPGNIFHQDEPRYNKTWIVHPILVEVDTDQIKTDWEAEEILWTTIDEALQKDLVPGFDKVLESFR